MSTINAFIVAKIDDVRVYSNENYQQIEGVNIPIELLAADTREPN